MASVSFSASDLVPVVHHLGDIYDDEAVAVKRYDAIAAKFRSLYGCDPAFYARAPGRVNLIGEHIDYCGYSVLPMAIQRDTVIAGSIQTSANVMHSMAISNTDERYSVATFADNKALFTIIRDHHWYKYVQCGFKGVFNALRRGGERAILPSDAPADAASADDVDFTGYHHHKLQLLVDGNVPPSAGLSSSSSLVCASAVCASFSHSFLPVQPKRTLAEICCHCERYVGTMGGGMDQAISFLSTSGVAQRIDFDPLVNTPIILPRDSVFVVCNSLFESEKAVQASKQFNYRVLECKLAALILAKHFKMNVHIDTNKAVSDGALTVQQLTFKKVEDFAKVRGGMAQFVASHIDILHTKPYTLSEVEHILGVQSLSALLSYNINFASVIATRPSLRLRQRALHVYSESQRVLDFQGVCSTADASVEKLGQLMNDSHRSCRDDYECSCEDLEVLIRMCNAAGAAGCRLTGAGWGGCAVALFDGAKGETAIAAAIDNIKRQFYYEYKKIKATDPRMADFIFTTKPASGAAVYVPPSQQNVDANGKDVCAYHSHLIANTSLTSREPIGTAPSEKWWNALPLPWHGITFIALGVMTGLVIAVMRSLSNKPISTTETRVTSANTATRAGASIVEGQYTTNTAHSS